MSRPPWGALALCLSLPLVTCLSLGAPASRAAVRDDAVVGLQLEPPILDPGASPAAAIAEVLYGTVFEGLVRFAPDGSVAPALAASWEISPDGLVYTFHLREHVRFSDGTPFDAATAKFSLDRAIAPGSVNPQRARLAAIAAVDVPAPDTLRLRLSRRSGGLLQSLAWASCVMVAPNSAAGNALHPVGTGPFRFLAWRRGDSLDLVRNADYWGEPAKLAHLRFRFIADPTAAYAALMSGDIDVFSNYPAPESVTQFKRDARFRVFSAPSEGETILAFNHRRAPLADLRVRRAISLALDRRAIIDGAMYGYGTPIGSHFPPGNPAYLDLTARYPHDVAAAKALLREAGAASGLALTLKLPPPAYARRSGEIVAAQLAEVGIQVKIQNLEWAQWLDQVYTRHDFDLSIVAHVEPADYDIYARDDYYFGYANPQFKALIAGLEASVDAGERLALLHDVQRRLADDAVNGFLFQLPWLVVANAHLQSLGLGGVLGVIDFRAAEFDAAAPPRDPRAAPTAESRALRTLAVLALLAAVALILQSARRLGSAYLGGRLAWLLATLVFATAVVFTLVEVAPGDPVRYMLGLQADPDTVAALRTQLGLDASPWLRYLSWVTGLLRGDFGTSYTYRVPVATLLRDRLQVSLPLALYTLLLTLLVAAPVGLVMAHARGRVGTSLLAGATQLALSIPNFWLGLVLVLVFAVELGWFSAGGFPGWEFGLWPGLRALTLPAIALATPQAAILARVLGGALADTLHEDYIRSARAKGAGEWRILWRHALPNALIPVLTIIGMQFSFLLAGGVIIENVFFLPGLGRLVFQAIAQRDLIVVQGVVMVLVFAVVCVSFVVDIAYAFVNPRVRARYTGT